MIWIPEHVWSDLLDAFAAAPAGVERVAYLDGVVIDEIEPSGVVTTLVLPNAHLQPGRYVITADAMSAAAQHMRPNRLRRLIQIHTHGNDATGHSWVDDRDAYSQHNGAASLVLPRHGVTRPMPADGTLHLRRDEGWLPIRGDDIGQILRLVPSLVDQSNHRPEEVAACTEHDAMSQRIGILALPAVWLRRWKQRSR